MLKVVYIFWLILRRAAIHCSLEACLYLCRVLGKCSNLRLGEDSYCVTPQNTYNKSAIGSFHLLCAFLAISSMGKPKE